jgi:hypothetical protein
VTCLHCGSPIFAGSRRDRVLHEALTARADPLHLALVFGLSHTTASKYALIVCDLLVGQPAEAAEEGTREDRSRI